MPEALLNADVNYPRPQLRREHWIDLCSPWSFAHDDGDCGVEERWFETPMPFDRSIRVPYPPESKMSGVNATGFHPVVWYRKEIDLPDAERSQRLVLHFGAVDYKASVWINGKLACQHEGGNTPFSADITPLLASGERQVITVRAEDDPHDLQQPRGKQYWEDKPGYIWYHRTTGIWQPVWLESLPSIAISEIRWTPDLDRFGVSLTLRLDRSPPPGWRVRLRLQGDKPKCVLADDTFLIRGRELRRDVLFEISHAAVRRRRHLIWSPEDPNLIEAIIEILDDQGRLIDHVESYFGLRRIELDNGYFILNGIPTFLRLVLAQNYWPESQLAAPSAEALRTEVELAKSLGFNGIRIHQKVEDPRFLYWCDRLGMLVWGEMANAYVYSDRAAEMLVKEWLQVLRRDYNHPSIVSWVPLNESWGVPDLDRSEQQRSFVRALYSLTKALDPTRPVIGNDGWQHAVGDIFGIHDYAPNAELLRERYSDRRTIERTLREVRPNHYSLLTEGGALADQPIVISEYGGLSYKPQDSDDWFGYGQFANADELLARYEELTNALLDSTALAGYCYTQLTDTEQETNGLLSADRKPKLDVDRVRAINSRASRAVQSEILDALIKQEVDLRRRKRGED
jgi:hypothetical protein